MSDNKEQEPKKVLSLSGRPKLELKRGPDSTSQVRQSFSHGRSKAVTVEVKTQRVARPPLTLPTAPVAPVETVDTQPPRRPDAPPARTGTVPRQLTAEEREVRIRALKTAVADDRRHPEPEQAFTPEPEIEETEAAAPPQPAAPVSAA